MALRELRINDVVVIREARIEPGDGFTALTGETGAGKSVCVAALRLALGLRVDTDVVSPGSPRARVAAVFDAISTDVRERLDEAGVSSDDDLLTLSREIPRGGRGTCRINGALVAQSLLREVGEMLVEVTAQGSSQRLLRRSWQRAVLDDVGGAAVVLARDRVAAHVLAWRSARTALEDAQRLEQSSALDVERARQTIEDIGHLNLREDEADECAAERLRLRHAGAIVAATRRLHLAINGGEDGVGVDALAMAVAEIEGISSATAELVELLGRADEAMERLRDLAADARRISESVVDDPNRLAALEERLDTLARIRRRYGSIAGAMAALEVARAVVDAVDADGSAITTLADATDSRAREVAVAAAELSTLRTRAARKLEGLVTTELQRLELPNARFRTVLTRVAAADGIDVDGDMVQCTTMGIDEVEFRLAGNADGVPVPLAEGPSGGELSRLALALRALAAADCATLVLDEIDTGVGGETAARVGEVLARIGSTRQVVAITHRPEIAARATTHLVAGKATRGGVTTTTVEAVEGDRRVDEVARLMSGRTTSAARARARELLDEGAPVREPRVRRA